MQTIRNWFSSSPKKADGGDLPLPRQYGTNTGWGTGRLNAMLVGLLPGTEVDFAAEAGDLTLNSAVAMCLGFYTRNWCQARPRVCRFVDGQKTYVDDHPAQKLLDNPYPGIDAASWWEWVLTDRWILGNAILYKRRNFGGLGVPTALQFIPADMVSPDSDTPGQLLTHYWYRSGNQKRRIELKDVIHIRVGRDPNDIRWGRSPLVSGLREIVTDNKTSSMAAALTRNAGLATTLIAPKGDDVESLTEDEASVMKQRLAKEIGGDNMGGIGVLTGDFTSERVGFSPKDMDLGTIRETPELRVAGLFSIPPIVAGFGAGLKHATYNNFSEARQQAWEDGIMPEQFKIALVFTTMLLPDYPETQPGDFVEFDNSNVRALADDVIANRKDAATLFEKGVFDRAQAKRMAGVVPLPEDEGFYVWMAGANGSMSVPTAKTLPLLPIKKAGDVYSALASYRSARDQREEEAVKAMEGILSDVISDLSKRLEKLRAKMKAREESGQPLDEAWFRSEERFVELLAQAGKAYRDVADGAAEVVTDAQRDQAALGEQWAEQAVMSSLGKGASAAGVVYNKLPLAQLDALAGFMGDGTPISTYFGAIGEGAAAKIRTIIAKGIGRGAGADEMAREMETALKISRLRALNITRTESLRAGRAATGESWKNNSRVVTGFRRVCAGDKRVCAACWATHGRVYKLGETMHTHCQCRCGMVAILKTLAEITGDASLPDNRPAFPEADTLFARLAADDQKAILGVSGYRMWKDGLPLSAFGVEEEDPMWGPTIRPARVAELTAQGDEN